MPDLKQMCKKVNARCKTNVQKLRENLRNRVFGLHDVSYFRLFTIGNNLAFLSKMILFLA